MRSGEEKLIGLLLDYITRHSSDDDFNVICENLIDRGCHLLCHILKNGKGMYLPNLHNYVYVESMLICLLCKIQISQGSKKFSKLCLKFIYIREFFAYVIKITLVLKQLYIYVVRCNGY